jgi:outer membrane biosynthesis protein TonB
MLVYHPAMKHCLCLVTFAFLVAQSFGASDTAKQEEAITLLQQAVSKTNIFDLPSFAMKADVQIEEHGKLVDGTYQLLWNGQDQWKQEVRFPGYREVQIGGKGTVWVQRSAGFVPSSVYRLHEALGFGSSVGSAGSESLVRLALTPKSTVKKTSERKEHGEKFTCVEIENERKRSSEICVHNSSGVLARGPYYADGDLQPVGGKVFPRLLSTGHDSKTMAKVVVTDLSTPAQFPTDAFIPPTGASPQAGCMNPIPPRLVRSQSPDFPSSSRLQHHEGTVAFDVAIGIDGVPRIRKLVETPGLEDLETSSLHAISQWRYEPALCDGRAVASETLIQVNFTLSSF